MIGSSLRYEPRSSRCLVRKLTNNAQTHCLRIRIKENSRRMKVGRIWLVLIELLSLNISLDLISYDDSFLSP